VEAHVLDRVHHVGRFIRPVALVDAGHQLLQALLRERLLHEAQIIGQQAVEQRAAHGGDLRLGLRGTGGIVVVIAEQDGCMQIDDAQAVQILDLVQVHHQAPLAQVAQRERKTWIFAQVHIHIVPVVNSDVDIAVQQGVDQLGKRFVGAAIVQALIRVDDHLVGAVQLAALDLAHACRIEHHADPVAALFQRFPRAELLGAIDVCHDFRGGIHGEVVIAEHHILRGRHHGRAVSRLEQVLRAEHQLARFTHSLLAQRHMNGHLVAIEVRIERGTHQRMNLDRFAFDQQRLEGLDAQAVQRRRAVEQHWPFLNDFFQHFPYFGPLALDDSLGTFDIAGVVVLNQPADHEGAVQLQRHDLRQAALVELQLRTDDDHAAARVVHALAQQVAAETPLLALQHITQGLQLAPASATERLAALAVVDQAVHGFLKHALLVAHDHIRRAELQQALEAIVAVDHPAIEIVQVRCGEPATVKLHHRAQVGRNDRQHGQDHPFGPVVAFQQTLDHPQPLGRFLATLLAARGPDLMPQLVRQPVQIHVLEDFQEGFGTHTGLEDLPVFLLELAIARLPQELQHLERLKLVARLGGQAVQVAQPLLHARLQILVLTRRLRRALPILRIEQLALGLTARFHVFLDLVQALLGSFLNQLEQLVVDFLTLFRDQYIRRLEDEIGFQLVAHLRLDLARQKLRLGHHRFGHGALLGIESRVDIVQMFLEVGEVVLTPGAHAFFLLFKLGPDHLRLVRQVLIDALECLLPRFLIDVRDHVLRKVEHAVQITATDVQQDTQIARHAARIPHMRDWRRQFDMSQPFAAN